MTEERKNIEGQLEDLLPDQHPERRESNLTREDILLVGAVFKRLSATQVCTVGFTVDEVSTLRRFTAEEVGILKRFIGFSMKAATAVGLVFIVGACSLFALIFGRGFWAWIRNIKVN